MRSILLMAAIIHGLLLTQTELLYGQHGSWGTIGDSTLLRDSLWGRPFTYLDYFMMKVDDRLTERLAPITSSERNGLFTLTSPYPDTEPQVAVFLDPVSGRAQVGIHIVAGRLSKPLADVCGFLFKMFERELGANQDLPAYAIRNLFSYKLPKSAAAVASSSDHDRSYAVLFRHTDLWVTILEATPRQFHTCRRALTGASEIQFKTEPLSAN